MGFAVLNKLILKFFIVWVASGTTYKDLIYFLTKSNTAKEK